MFLLRLHDASPEISRRFLECVPNLSHLEIRSSCVNNDVFECIARLSQLKALDLTNVLVRSDGSTDVVTMFTPQSRIKMCHYTHGE